MNTTEITNEARETAMSVLLYRNIDYDENDHACTLIQQLLNTATKELREKLNLRNLRFVTLAVLIERIRCTCYIVGTDGTDGGNPKEVKCNRCEAIEQIQHELGTN